jgi:hypothetical protein
MRNRLIGIVLALLALGPLTAAAQVSVHIGIPDVRIDYRVATYPYLVRVPGYPVYYAPRLAANYFFYDGMYWVYRRGNWYASYWYDGPWAVVEPISVPVALLRVPVRYYRDPPQRFTAWRYDIAPRWVEVWGPSWEQQRYGWETYALPAIAPLPLYQRQYVGSRYPTALSQQTMLQSRYYRYQPRDTVAQTFYRQQGVQRMEPAQPIAGRQYTQQRVVTQPYAQQRYTQQQYAQQRYTQQRYTQQQSAQQARMNAAAARNDARMARTTAKHEAKMAKETAKYEAKMAKESAKAYREPKPAKYKEPKAPKHQMQYAESRAFAEPRFQEQQFQGPRGHEKAFHEPKGPKGDGGGGKEHGDKGHKGK